MFENRPAILLPLVAFALQLAACQPPEQPEMRGSLYFGAGNYLAEFDLRDGSTSVVANLGDVEIQEMSSLLDERLLLSVLGSVNLQELHRLVLFDIKTRQALPLVTGRHGRYLPGTRVLVYDDGSKIVMTERREGAWESTEILQHRYNAPVRILPLSATRFLYAEFGSAIHLYDKTTGESTRLDALGKYCDLDYTLWLPGHEKLLCRTLGSDESFTYPLVSLDGSVSEKLNLPGSRSFRPLAWLPDQDALVLSERWRRALSDRDRSAVWIYRFEDGTAFRLVDDQYLGGSVFYQRR